MALTFNDYLQAAKLVANCSRERLPLVIDILEQHGFDMEKGREILKEIDLSHRKKEKEKRKTTPKSRWRDSDNEITLLLRNEYKKGTKFTMLEKKTGLARLSLYRYLWGERIPNEYYSEVIKKALSEINEESPA